MFRPRPGAPEAAEYHPAFAGYIAKARPFDDPSEKLAVQLDQALALFGSLPPERRHYRYAAGKWSVQELISHITDTERIFAYRLLRVARGDATPLAGFDENAYATAAEADLCEWNSLLDEFTSVRRSGILLLRHVPNAAWTRMGTVHPSAFAPWRSLWSATWSTTSAFSANATYNIQAIAWP